MTLSDLRQQCAVCANAWRRFWPMRWTVVVSVVLGFLLSFSTPSAWVDALFPVVTMQATVLSKTPLEITVSLVGEKHRQCTYHRIDAYAVGPLKTLRDLNMERINIAQDRDTKPLGKFDFGVWRIWPSKDIRQIVIYVEYDCNGRTVFVNVAEVML